MCIQADRQTERETALSDHEDRGRGYRGSHRKNRERKERQKRRAGGVEKQAVAR